jgi:sarcosine oxidase
MNDFDVAVIGLGAMGSAALYHLSKNGASVVGFDQYHPPHQFGSTHGDTRITRLAIGEGSEYVPLVSRSHQLWRDLEEESGEEIFNQCGGLVLASKGNPFLEQTIGSAKEYAIDHVILTSQEIQDRYPALKVNSETFACYEPSAGYVIPEKAVATQLALAKENNAKVCLNTTVEKIENNLIKTSQGQFSANKIIVAAGSWSSGLLPEMKEMLQVYRQLLYWFPIEKNYQKFVDMPIFIWEFGQTPDDFIYGFPAIDGPGGGIKVATEEYQKTVSAEIGKLPASQEEIVKMTNNYIKPNLPWLGVNPIRTVSCLYTNTKDGRFLIDEIRKDTLVISACSGHGFKHSAAIGEAVCQLALNGSSQIDLDFFKI